MIPGVNSGVDFRIFLVINLLDFPPPAGYLQAFKKFASLWIILGSGVMEEIRLKRKDLVWSES